MVATEKKPKRLVLARISRLLACLGAMAVTSLYLCYKLTHNDGPSAEPSTYRSQIKTGSTCAAACAGAGDEWLADVGEPFAYVAGDGEIDPGDCVCIRAVVPQNNRSSGSSDEYRPIPGWPTDSLMVDIVMDSSDDPLYKDARVTVSVDMRERTSQMAGIRRYQGVAQLYDPGVYELDARLEYRAGQWNAEAAGQPMVRYNEQLMANSGGAVHVRTGHTHPTHLSRHQKQPLCTEADASGRWIPLANLPGKWHKQQHLPAAEDGRVWIPYHCRLRQVSYAEFAYHMAHIHPSVHWFGDSNSRRTLRPFVMGGQWCHEANTTERLDCLCNDAPKDLFPSEWYPQMPVPHWYRVYGTGVDSSEIYADLRRPPHNRSPVDARPLAPTGGFAKRRDFFDLYYLFTRGTLDMYGSHWARDISAAAASPLPRASLVVVQLVTWDVAFGEFAQFAHHVEQLAMRLRSVYPHARFVYRSGPYWCCRAAETADKRYSRLRFMAFDQHARMVFRRMLDARVWDVMGPQAARPPESKRLAQNMPCRSAHTRSELIHIDNQLLMNMVANSHNTVQF